MHMQQVTWLGHQICEESADASGGMLDHIMSIFYQKEMQICFDRVNLLAWL